MTVSKQSAKELNWVDPDVLAYYEGMPPGDSNRMLEKGFKDYFEHGWQSPKYDDLRERWDPLIRDEEPTGRLYGKIALWNVIRLRELREQITNTRNQ